MMSTVLKKRDADTCMSIQTKYVSPKENCQSWTKYVSPKEKCQSWRKYVSQKEHMSDQMKVT